MDHIYFGYEPRAKGASKLAISTENGELEPMEPSKVKVFCQKTSSHLYGMMTGVLGFLIAILSFPFGTYANTHVEGVKIRADDSEDLPFGNPGMSVCVKKGRKLADQDHEGIEKRGFTSMVFGGRTLYVKEGATDDDFLFVSDMALVDTSGPTPGRYLNVDAYESWLILRLVTKKICQLFHYLALGSQVGPVSSSTLERQNEPKNDGWFSFDNLSEDTTMATGDFEFKNPKGFVLDGLEKRIQAIQKCHYTAGGSSINNSSVVVNAFAHPVASGFIRAGDTKEITSPGRIFKFHPQLARPDPNLITDVIGKFFLTALGETWSDQQDILQQLKIGISQLRLTRLGDELCHLFKCIEVAIESHSGAIPFFHGSSYEGCIISGNMFGNVSFLIQSRRFEYLSVSDLKNSFLTVSTHEKYLSLIANHFQDTYRTFVLQTNSMRKLWAYCQLLECTQDVRDIIIRAAAHLDYGQPPLVINPHNLKLVCSWINDINLMPITAPISRLSLFSKDPVLLGLGCFGEKSAPSWNIPGGIECSLKKRTVPVPIVSPVKAGRTKGSISDAAWTMVVMRTDLVTAVEDFKSMAIKMKYRSTGSAMAKKVGHIVFNRERMAEFWTTLQDALKTVNPKAEFDQEGGTSGSPDTLGREPPSKKRKIDFVSPSKKKLARMGEGPTGGGEDIEEDIGKTFAEETEEHEEGEIQE